MPSTTLVPDLLTAGDPTASSAVFGRPSMSRLAYDMVSSTTQHPPAIDPAVSLVTTLYSLEELANATTLIHALLASFSVILVSELGDKTFIITAIMAMKNSRSLVFLSSASALLLMTVLSVGMGVAASVIPEVYTHYASIVLFLCFGVKMLKESYDMDGDSTDESEFDEVKRELEQEQEKENEQCKSSQKATSIPDGQTVCSTTRPIDGNNNNLDGSKSELAANLSPGFFVQLRQALHVAPIVIKVFTMIFVAEWGDRSQISTVILAAREDVVGVFIGSLSGHIFCTGLAVIGGRFVADLISVRTSKYWEFDDLS